MKIKLLAVLILFLFIVGGCHHRKDEPPRFSTPFGEIRTGYAMSEVMNVLGNPHHITSGKETETWYYYLGKDKVFFVDFVGNKVIDVRKKPTSE
ncbi:MAG: hypothetical protein JSW17_00370 [Candidatus Omnitrophota bacterium]|nr:MAG: hypothetical protein JSW17_00370 [Candidatus Omnitrophota bacterium]